MGKTLQCGPPTLVGAVIDLRRGRVADDCPEPGPSLVVSTVGQYARFDQGSVVSPAELNIRSQAVAGERLDVAVVAAVESPPGKTDSLVPACQAERSQLNKVMHLEGSAVQQAGQLLLGLGQRTVAGRVNRRAAAVGELHRHKVVIVASGCGIQ